VNPQCSAGKTSLAMLKDLLWVVLYVHQKSSLQKWLTIEVRFDKQLINVEIVRDTLVRQSTNFQFSRACLTDEQPSSATEFFTVRQHSTGGRARFRAVE